MRASLETITKALGLEDQVFNVAVKETGCNCAPGFCNCLTSVSVNEECNDLIDETVGIINQYALEDFHYGNLAETATLLTLLNSRIVDAPEEGLSRSDATEIRTAITEKLAVLEMDNPLPIPAAWDVDPVEATSIALEGFTDLVSTSVEALVHAIQRLYEMLKALAGKLMVIMRKLRNKARENSETIYRTTNDDVLVENVPENYLTIEKNIGSYYNHELKAFSSDLINDVKKMGSFLVNGFKPYLQDEIETALSLIDIYRPLTTASLDYDRDAIGDYNTQIDTIYSAQTTRISHLFGPFEGMLLGGLTIKRSQNSFGIELAKGRIRESKVQFLALSPARLDLLNNAAGEILDIANTQLHALYESYEKASQKGVDTITTIAKVYQKDKEKNFNGGKAKRLDGLIAKHFAHFRNSSSTVSNTINVFSYLSYSIVNDFVPKNIAILNNLKSL